MTWYKDILHLFTKLVTDPFKILLEMEPYARAIPKSYNVYNCIINAMTYALPFIVKAMSPILGIKRMTGLTHFDLVSALANASFLIFQIIIGAFVIWRLLSVTREVLGPIGA